MKRLRTLSLGGMLASALLMAPSAMAATKTLKGTVTDAMCGAHHMMAGNPAACTRACVKKGSDYALVVGDEVYTLKTSNAKAKAELNKLAGAEASVTGDVDGTTLTVTSVKAAK
jgi:hypothetical protein